MRDAKKALVHLGFSHKKDGAAAEGQEEPLFDSVNNNKLVMGSGYVTAKDSLRDELFGLTAHGALRLYRRVEVLEEYKGMIYPD